MSPQNPLPHRTKSMSSVARRCSIWFALPLSGNIMLLTVMFTLSQDPVGLDWQATLRAIAPFVLPAYAPALLFFTAILAVFDGRAIAPRDKGDQVQANRMIASAVRLALAIVLSFAIIVVLIEPTMLIHVLFAMLLSFVAIVRAEVFAPARTPSAEERYGRALTWKRDSASWASQSLGTGWNKAPERRLWPTVLMMISASVVVPTLALVIGGITVWGLHVALAPGFVLTSAASMIGPVMLILTWLSSADKADSPRGRVWRRAYLLIMSVIVITTITLIFFVSGKNTVWMGWIVLCTSVATGILLLTPRPRWITEPRKNIERRWTRAHLKRIEQEFARAEEEWKRELDKPPVGVRALATIIRPFRHAFRVAGEQNVS